MGINIISKNKKVSMSCSSFNLMRQFIAEAFNKDFYIEYKKIFDAVIGFPNNNDYKNLAKVQDVFENYTAKFLKSHANTETLRMVTFFRMSDVSGEINKNYCKYILKYLKKAYDDADDKLKTTFQYICQYNDMVKLLEDGMTSGGINWS